MCQYSSINHIFRLPLNPAFKIVKGDFYQPFPCFKRCPGNMRRNDAVWCTVQRTGVFHRFGRKNVASVAGDFSGFKGRTDVVFCDKSASCGIYDVCAVFHFIYRRFIYNSGCFCGKRGVQGDEIRLFPKFFLSNAIRNVCRGAVRADEYVHSECFCDFCNLPYYISVASNSKCFSI